jgi:hypothetical protein
VTGTFDAWSKSEKLEKVGDHFEKDVTLASADEKIYYKVRLGRVFLSLVTLMRLRAAAHRGVLSSTLCVKLSAARPSGFSNSALDSSGRDMRHRWNAHHLGLRLELRT